MNHHRNRQQRDGNRGQTDHRHDEEQHLFQAMFFFVPRHAKLAPTSEAHLVEDLHVDRAALTQQSLSALRFLRVIRGEIEKRVAVEENLSGHARTVPRG